MEGCNHVPLSQDGHHAINAIGLAIFCFKAFISRNYILNAHSSKIEKASVSCVTTTTSEFEFTASEMEKIYMLNPRELFPSRSLSLSLSFS